MNVQIGELTKRTVCPVQTIRHYEREGLSPLPDHSPGSFRSYSGQYIERLQFILHCRPLDVSLNDVRALLRCRERPDEDCSAVNTLLDEHIEEVERHAEALGALKHYLCALCETYSDGQAAEACGILQGLSEDSGTRTRDGTRR